jgi:hypothetical protein
MKLIRGLAMLTGLTVALAAGCRGSKPTATNPTLSAGVPYAPAIDPANFVTTEIQS